MQPLRIEARFARPLNFADFDKKSMRKGFTQVGRDVSKIAKKLVSKKGVSAAGAYPGKQTGIFQKAISYKVSRSGFSVAVKPYGKGKQVSAELKRRGGDRMDNSIHLDILPKDEDRLLEEMCIRDRFNDIQIYAAHAS